MKKIGIIILGVVIALAGFFYVRDKSQVNISRMDDAGISVAKKKNASVIVVTPKNSALYFSTTVTDSDNYIIYAKKMFPWDVPSDRTVRLKYVKLSNGQIERPNGTIMDSTDTPRVILEFAGDEEKHILLE